MRRLSHNQRLALERLSELGESWTYPTEIADDRLVFLGLHEGTARSVLPLLTVKGLCESEYDGNRTKYRITELGRSTLAHIKETGE